ncbi:hypothetical protein [Chryseobacterium sp. R2A-55]|uniref:hypothetical protein n=1 Tax=Chryseobacterium sp. R2A-55 TaxID=2744445 RepID=UPI001F220979|nr:hypothetical protein [Chryseobacterium sp. R2A-55]
MAKQRASSVEKEKRIFTIQGWIIDGVQDYLIKKQVLNWGISGRQSERYIAEAYNRWKKDKTIELVNRRDARIAELQQDIRGMSEDFKRTPQGLRVMLAYKKEISKLEDLYPARHVKISGDAENPVHVRGNVLSDSMEEKFREYLKKEYKFK